MTIAPLMRIEVTGPMPDLSDATGLIFTSANGVAAFGALSDRRDLPAVCVGAATTAAARDLGLEATQGGTDAANLAANLPPDADACWMHLHGAHVTGDLAGLLRARGIAAQAAAIYDQRATPLGATARAAIEAGEITDIALFSPRSARLLVEALAPDRPWPPLRLVCLSQAVAGILADAGPSLSPATVLVCSTPDAQTMIRLLNGQSCC